MADPVGPQPKGCKQFARTWGELSRAVELAWIASPSKAEWAAIDARSGHSVPDAKDGDDEEKADTHIRAARQATQIGQHATAVKHLARASALTSDPAKHAAVNTLRGAVAKNAALRGQSQQLVGMAASWDDLAAVISLGQEDVPADLGPHMDAIRGFRARIEAGDTMAVLDLEAYTAGLDAKTVREVARRTDADVPGGVEMSAGTAQLEVTPAPYGRPGGPGLYHVKGLKHSDYLENIVQALMRKGMDKGKATAIARGSIRRWMRGGGHVPPEVRAAAAGAEAEELKAQARAHAHAVTWDDLAAVVDLATAPRTWDGLGAVIELASAPARVPAGQAGGGQFAAGATGAAPTNAAPVGMGASGAQVSSLADAAQRAGHEAAAGGGREVRPGDPGGGEGVPVLAWPEGGRAGRPEHDGRAAGEGTRGEGTRAQGRRG